MGNLLVAVRLVLVYIWPLRISCHCYKEIGNVIWKPVLALRASDAVGMWDCRYENVDDIYNLEVLYGQILNFSQNHQNETSFSDIVYKIKKFHFSTAKPFSELLS